MNEAVLQFGGPLEPEATGTDGLGVGDPPQMQVYQSARIDLAQKVFCESQAACAQLGLRPSKQHPVGAVGVVGKPEANRCGAGREGVHVDQLDRRPQDVGRVQMTGFDLEPAGTPLAEGVADRAQGVAAVGARRMTSPRCLQFLMLMYAASVVRRWRGL